MTDIAALERRVERLESRIAIEELVSAYGVACDEHDMPGLEALFTEDAEFDSPSGVMRAKGRAEILEMFVRAFKVRGPGYHWTHDPFIRIDGEDPDRAKGRVLSHAETTPNGLMSLAAMKYDDDYRRVDGRWLFSRRVIQFLYYVPAKDYPQGMTKRRRLFFGDAWLEADYPENLPAWREFDRMHKNDSPAAQPSTPGGSGASMAEPLSPPSSPLSR